MIRRFGVVLLIAVIVTLLPAVGALGLVFPTPPFDFANASFAGRPWKLNPTEGNTPTPLLVIFIPLTELFPGSGPSSVGYTGYDDAFFRRKIFGGPLPDAGDPATWIDLASRGQFQWTPASESAGTPNDGIVIVSPQTPASLPARCRVGYRALELADPFVDFSVFDTTGAGDSDGNLQSSELSVLVLVGDGSAGGAPGGDAQSCDVNTGKTPSEHLELDGVTFEALWAARAGGPNLADTANTPDMIHELNHTRFRNQDFYGQGIGSMGIMGTTINGTQPRGPSALTRLLLGWSDVQIAEQDGWYTLERADRSGDALIVYDPTHGTDEYFLIENRVQDATDSFSIDRGIPDSGLYLTTIDVDEWDSDRSVPEFLRVDQPIGVKAAPACRYGGNLASAVTAGAPQLQVGAGDTGFPTPPFQARIANAGELDEVVTVSSIAGTVLTLQNPLLLPHGAGAFIEYRNTPWTGSGNSYFAGLLAPGADSGLASFQIATPMWGNLPVTTGGTVLPQTFVRIYTDSDNPYENKNPDTYALMSVSPDGSTWTVAPPLTRDYPANARMSEGYKGGCGTIGGQSAWDANDPSPPQTGRTLNWPDGSDSGFKMLGVGPAADIARVYIDVPESNGLYSNAPRVLRPDSAVFRTFGVTWETWFTGAGSTPIQLVVSEAGHSDWLNRVGSPNDSSRWTTQTLIHNQNPPSGLSVDYSITVPANPSFDESGSIPVDWPFPSLPSLSLVGWTPEGTPSVSSSFMPSRPWVLTNQSQFNLSFGEVDEIHDHSLSMPGLLTAELPVDFPTFPACGEVDVGHFVDVGGAEHLIRAETIFEVDVEALDSFENRADILVLDPGGADQRTDWSYPLHAEIVCPSQGAIHQISVEPRDAERLQRYRYRLNLRQSTHFFPEVVNGLADILRVNGTPARSVPCAGGFFPRCSADPFNEVRLLLPPALTEYGPPGCPAGCPNHYVVTMSDAFPYLDLSLSVPPGTTAFILDGLGNVVSSSFPIALHEWNDGEAAASFAQGAASLRTADPDALAVCDPARAPADTDLQPTTRAVAARRIVPRATRPAAAATGAPAGPDGLALSAAEEATGTLTPPSPFLRNTPVAPPPRDEIGLIMQGAPGTYYLRIDLPKDFDASLDPEPISVLYTTFDRDADGFFDAEDNCPDVAQIDQADSDNDTVGDACDNCASLENPDQNDLDGDGEGDLCDGDRDGDGLANGVETNTGQYASPNDTGSSPDAFDTDNDGISDGDEVQNGWDPNDPGSPPPAIPLPMLGALGTLLASALLGFAGAGRARRRGC